jgi:hypothetical protein
MLLAQAAAQTVPWWGTALLGGVVGAVIAQLCNLYIEHRKASREWLRHEQTLRREALASYLSAAAQYLANDEEPVAQASLWSTFYSAQMVLPSDMTSEVEMYHRDVVAAKMPAESDEERSARGTSLIDSQRQLIDTVLVNRDTFGLPNLTKAELKAAKARSRPINFKKLYEQAQQNDPDLR